MTCFVQIYKISLFFYKFIDVAIDTTINAWYNIDVIKTTTTKQGGNYNEKF